MLPNTLIVICGATASGKTDISLELSKYLDIEIISADSRQLYKLLDIGTAKPSDTELKKVKHHFIDCLDIDAEYSAGEYGNQAYQTYLDIINRGKTPVVVGGSGLYIKSLCEGLFDSNININNQVRAEIENELNHSGIDKLYEELRLVDEKSFILYGDKNPRRILRALEYYRTTGIALSHAQKEFAINRGISGMYFAVDFLRGELYDRINKRTHVMWEMGLANETQKVLDLGYSENLTSLNTVGYKETIQYLKGSFSIEKAIEEIQKNTRHYAKRQLTWFRKVPTINFLPVSKIIRNIMNNYS